MPADPPGTDRAGTGPTGSDSADTEPAGTDSAGTDSAGTDSAGTDSAGADRAGTDTTGADAAGAASEGTEPAGVDSAGDQGPRAAWARLWAAGLSRPSRSQVVVGLLLFALGLGAATQAQLTVDAGLTGLRQSELVRLLDDVTERRARLEAERADLETRLQRLTSDTGSSEEAREAAEERRDAYAILAGTVRATGPGVTVTIRDDAGLMRARTLLDAIQELRDAGAEAIQVGDVRVVTDTAFLDVSEGLQIDGEVVRSPYRIVAIGDPSTLETALRIPGGVVESVGSIEGADIAIVGSDTVLVDAVRPLQSPAVAEPDTGDTSDR